MRPCLNQCPRCIALPQSMSTLHRGSMLHHGDDGDDEGRCQRAWTRLRLQERRLLLRSAKLRCSSMPRATLLMVHVRACGALCQEPPCLWYIIVRVVLFAKSLLAYGHSLFMVIGDSLLWCFFAWSFSPHSLPGHSLLGARARTHECVGQCICECLCRGTERAGSGVGCYTQGSWR
jgi:hypothetical protein